MVKKDSKLKVSILKIFGVVPVQQSGLHYIPQEIHKNEYELDNYINVRKVDIRDELIINLVKKGVVKITHEIGEKHGKEVLTVKASINSTTELFSVINERDNALNTINELRNEIEVFKNDETALSNALEQIKERRIGYDPSTDRSQ